MVRRCGSSLPRGVVGRKRDGRHPLGVLPFLRRRPQQSMPPLAQGRDGRPRRYDLPAGPLSNSNGSQLGFAQRITRIIQTLRALALRVRRLP
jgi:hypothetical protein